MQRDQIPYLKHPDGELQTLKLLCEAMTSRRQRLRNGLLLLEIDRFIVQHGKWYNGRWGADAASRHLHSYVNTFWNARRTTTIALSELSEDGFVCTVSYGLSTSRQPPLFVWLNVERLEEIGIKIGWITAR